MTLHEKIFRQEESFGTVWQITEPDRFCDLLSVYLKMAEEAEKQVVCLRFAEQSLFAKETGGLSEEWVNELNRSEQLNRTVVRDVELTHRFELFTLSVYKIVQMYPDAWLLFDVLSDMQTAWATDLMIINFFRVILPAVRSCGSRAVFPLIRGKHADSAVQTIREQSELFLDMFLDFQSIFVRAQKLEDCEGEMLYLPHIYSVEEGLFAPILEGVSRSRFQKVLNQSGRMIRGSGRDSWERFFERAQMEYEEGRIQEETCSRMCDIMMSRDSGMRALIRQHFAPEDYFYVREHMVGTGLIGGKACGMLTARKIVENELPEIYDRMEPHDSFFIGSDVFYTYLVENNLWELRVRQREEESYFSAGKELETRLCSGLFSEPLRKELVQMLEYYGHSPLIVRSSSILEDGFGNAFAGKYESVFCANEGTEEERLQELEDAIRTVYASTMNESALDYRLRRGLDQRDEQMALLVQRVSGSYYQDDYFPCAAGVGYSYSTYRFLQDINPSAGMLRLVMGLGTTAVDRTEGSYPRLVSLDRPEAGSWASSADHHRHSQKQVGVVSRRNRRLEQAAPAQIEQQLPGYLKRMMFVHDTEAERMFRDRGTPRDVTFIGCQGLVKNGQMMKDFQEILQCLQESYHKPVDIEFALNIDASGAYVINLLQCRPLQTVQEQDSIVMPDAQKDVSVLAECVGASMGNSGRMRLDVIVMIDPEGYYNLPYQNKPEIARIVHAVNWAYRNTGKGMLLLAPGRVGTSSPELGVPVSYADISTFSAIFELADSRAGYNPELSYGSHFFQDLVENEILYAAVFEDARTVQFHPERLSALTNHLGTILPEWEKYESIAGVYELPEDRPAFLYHDAMEQRILCVLDKDVSERK